MGTKVAYHNHRESRPNASTRVRMERDWQKIRAEYGIR